MFTHKALKTFQGRYGKIRAGQPFSPDPGYAKALLKQKMIVEIEADDPAQKQPGPGEQREDKSIPRAPHEKNPGKGKPGKSAEPGSTTAATPDAGKEPSLSVLDQGPASRTKTLTTSGAGGKRASRKRPVKQPPKPPAAE